MQQPKKAKDNYVYSWADNPVRFRARMKSYARKVEEENKEKEAQSAREEGEEDAAVSAQRGCEQGRAASDLLRNQTIERLYSGTGLLNALAPSPGDSPLGAQYVPRRPQASEDRGRELMSKVLQGIRVALIALGAVTLFNILLHVVGAK